MEDLKTEKIRKIVTSCHGAVLVSKRGNQLVSDAPGAGKPSGPARQGEARKIHNRVILGTNQILSETRNRLRIEMKLKPI